MNKPSEVETEQLDETLAKLCAPLGYVEGTRTHQYIKKMIDDAITQTEQRVRDEWKEEREQMLAQLREAGYVYCEITGGALSKTNYDSKTVLSYAQQETQKLVDEEVERVREEIMENLKKRYIIPSSEIILASKQTEEVQGED